GRTALKVHVGRYLEGAGTSGTYLNTNPTMRMPQTTPATSAAGVTRPWIDANVNFVPDCDLLNPNAQDLRPGGGDLCGVVSNTSFGRNALTNNFDPAILSGWGVRPSDWTLDVSLQQQILERTSVTVSYSRRWFHGFTVADNTAVQASDLTPFSVVAPLDPRLPGSGVDATINLRTERGLTFVGGTSTGQSVADNCDVRRNLPELSTATTGTSAFGGGFAGLTVSPASPYCHVAFGIQTQFRGLASYTLPAVDVQLSATLQSKPGPMLAANYAVPNSAAAVSL